MRPDPHVFVPDPDQPADRTGRRPCRECGLVGSPDDGHHTTPGDDPESSALGVCHFQPSGTSTASDQLMSQETEVVARLVAHHEGSPTWTAR